ncbi:MAG: hypothetical protein KVP17_002827, partial [Porospora cf. gigantea B]
MRAFSTAILYSAICTSGAFADTSLRGPTVSETDLMSKADKSRTELDLSLLTDLNIKPTAVDVAMLQTLLSSLGSLLGRSVFEVDGSDSVEAVDKERVVYETAAVVTSAKALIAGPAIAAILAGPVVKSILSIGKIVAGHPLVAISALLGLAPVILGPALKVLLAGPALLPALGLLGALKLGAHMAAPVIAGVAFAALLVVPAISVILPGIVKLMGKMKSLLPMLLPLLMSGPFGPLVAAVLPLLAPLLGPLSAVFTGPAVMSFVALIQALLSGKTLLPLEKGVRALPLMLAAA